MPKKSLNIKWIFFLILALSTVARLLLSIFPKTAVTYNDELFYLELAQNLWLRGTATVYTAPIHFTKLLYPLLLAPFYAVKDGMLRVQLISAFNALLMSSVLIPGYVLAKRTLKKTWHIVFVLLFLALSPNLLFSITFMAENLYYPLLLWGFYAAYRYFSCENPKPLHAFLLGVLAFVLYFAKEVGAAYAAGVAGALLASRMGNKKGRKEVYLPLGLYLLGIAVPYLILRFTLLSGMGYSYTAQVSFDNLQTASQLLYFLYAAGMMLLFFLLSVLWFPAALPVLYYRKLSPAKQRLLVLAVCYTLFLAAGVAFGVSLFSDYPRIDIRVHLRYFLGAAFPFLLLSLPLEEAAEPVSKKSRLLWHTAVFAGLIIIFLVFPQFGSLVDAPVLQFTRRMSSSPRWLWFWKLAPVVGLASVLLLWNKKRKQAFACLLSLLLLAEAASGVLFAENARKELSVTNAQLINDVKAVDQYLDSAEGTALVLSDSAFDTNLRVLNTLSDKEYAFTTYRDVRETARVENVPDPRRLSYAAQPLPNPISVFSDRPTYEFREVRHIITFRQLYLLDPDGYTDVTPLGVSTLRIYRPKDPSILALRDFLAYIPGTPITFHGDDPTHFYFSPSGFSDPEASWCWTDSKEASLTLRPQTDGPKDLEVTWSWMMTHGEQPCQLYANDTLVLDESLTTEDAYCFFTIPKEAWPDGTLKLRFLFPDANPPGGADPRELAVAFDTLILSEE